MDASAYAFVHGIRSPGATLSAWNRRPWPPHALPELVALFLPLAAWILASRRAEWDQLLAATLVTVVLAVPVLVISALGRSSWRPP